MNKKSKSDLEAVYHMAPNEVNEQITAFTSLSAIPEETHEERAKRLYEEWRKNGQIGTLDVQGYLPGYRIDLVPDGFVYDYKSVLTPAMDAIDNTKMMDLRLQGYLPVPASRHPELASCEGYGGNIVVKDLMLMERPKQIADEDYRRSMAEIRNNNVHGISQRNRDMLQSRSSAPVDSVVSLDRDYRGPR